MPTDSGGLWTEQVEKEYQAFRRRLKLFTGEHEAYFVTREGDRQLFRYETRNWLGDRLTKRIAELVFPGFPRIHAARKADQKVCNELVTSLRLVEMVYPTALMVSWAGSATWKVYRSRTLGGPAVRVWGTEEGEFAVWDYRPGDYAAPYAVNFWYGTKVGDDLFRVNERYELRLGGGVRLTNRAWRTLSGEGEEVPLVKAFPEGTPPPPPKMDLAGRTLLPGYAIPNVDLFGTSTGDSDYSTGLIEIQRQVNRVSAQRALVIALTGLPQFRIPKKLIKKDGTIDLRQVWLQIEYEGEVDTPIRIENWEGNMQNTKDELDVLNEEFIRGSILSKAIDGEVQGGGESGYARRLSMVKLEAGVFRRRAPYDRAFEWVLRAAQELRGDGKRVGDLSVLWPPPIPEDPEATGRIVAACLPLGAMSRERAVRLLNPSESSEWVQEELARIEKEQPAPAPLPGISGDKK